MLTFLEGFGIIGKSSTLADRDAQDVEAARQSAHIRSNPQG